MNEQQSDELKHLAAKHHDLDDRLTEAHLQAVTSPNPNKSKKSLSRNASCS